MKNTVTEEAVECMPIMEELDTAPTSDEISKATDALTTGKALGKDGILSEILWFAKNPSLGYLCELLSLCWREGTVPQDIGDANIVTLYINKGDRGDCNNYCSISFLSIVGKLFAHVVLKRLLALADRVYPEAQCRFRANRSIFNMVFSLRQLQEKCKEQGKSLYIAPIDLKEAFELLSRDDLFKIINKVGCLPTLLSIMKSFHNYMKGTIV